jgi:hypothetical protein
MNKLAEIASTMYMLAGYFDAIFCLHDFGLFKKLRVLSLVSILLWCRIVPRSALADLGISHSCVERLLRFKVVKNSSVGTNARDLFLSCVNFINSDV